MLVSLHIKNFAIIDEAEVEFKENLNIMTGETGAGKSILIGSINAVLGGKVSKEMIRGGAEYALVELLFESNDDQVADKLDECGISVEDGQISISRKIMMNGRNINKINGENVTAAYMKEVAAYLMDLHGQHEHQSLMDTRKHLEFIDRFAKDDVDGIKATLGAAYHEYAGYKKELDGALIDDERKQREISFLEYEISEIESAKLKVGEDEALQADYKRLKNASHIMEGASQINKYLDDDEASVTDAIGKSLKILSKMVEYDGSINDMYVQLERIESLVHDFNRDITAYVSDMDNTEEEFKAVEGRLDTVNHLKSKYGRTIDAIYEYLDKSKDRLAKLQDYDKYISDLRHKISEKMKELDVQSEALSRIRRDKARILTSMMIEALIELNFLEVRFDMVFNRLPDYTVGGLDSVEFIISTNPGEPMLPLIKIASGGELSRIMLALKSVLADKDEVETLIFDEIDVGVSGRTAQKVSEKLALISRKHQVICITHLPQIASMADMHFLIEKTTDNVTTKTEILPLGHGDSVKELARMLGGAKITDNVLKNAEEMKDLAKKVKKSIL